MIIEPLQAIGVDQDYMIDLDHIVHNGCLKESRAGDTLSEFGMVSMYSLQQGRIPLLTCKDMPLKTMLHEFIWFMSGETKLDYLHEHNVHIWDAWATDNDLPNVYQKQWFKWEDTKYAHLEEVEKYVDKGYEQVGTADIDGIPKFVMRKVYNQFQRVIDELIANPESRRLHVNAWNVGDLDFMALPPCHRAVTFYTLKADTNYRFHLAVRDGLFKVHPAYSELSQEDMEREFTTEEAKFAVVELLNIPKYVISAQLDLRSSDRTLGYPFNIAHYAILTHIIGAMTNMYPDKLLVVSTDAHVYLNHLEDKADGSPSGFEQQTTQWNDLIERITGNSDAEASVDDITINGEVVVSHGHLVLSDKVATLKSDELHLLTFDDIKIEGYKALPKVVYPKASV